MEKTYLDIPPQERYFSIYVHILLAFLASIYIVIEGQQKPALVVIQQKNFYVSLVFSFFIAITLLILIHYISLYLDKRWDWNKRPVLRLMLQFVFGFVLVAYLDILFIKAVFHILNADFEKSGYMLIEFPKVKWMLGVVNFLYWIKAMSPELLSWNHFIVNRKSTPSPLAQENNPAGASFSDNGIQSIIGKLGNKSRHISLDEIACIKCESRSGYVYLKNNAVFNIDYRTQDLLDVLDSRRFYQTNRGIIFSFDVIESYRRDKKEGLLILKQEINPDVSRIVSRERFRDFKAAFEAQLQL